MVECEAYDIYQIKPGLTEWNQIYERNKLYIFMKAKPDV